MRHFAILANKTALRVYEVDVLETEPGDTKKSGCKLFLRTTSKCKFGKIVFESLPTDTRPEKGSSIQKDEKYGRIYMVEKKKVCWGLEELNEKLKEVATHTAVALKEELVYTNFHIKQKNKELRCLRRDKKRYQNYFEKMKGLLRQRNMNNDNSKM